MRNNHQILVTGGAGYIGSHIVEKLLENKKNKVIIYDNLITGHKRLINKKAVFIKGDIKNTRYLSRIIKAKNIVSIIHLAALLNVSEAEKNKKKYFENNVTGTMSLIKACENSSVKNIIFSSSCSVYGEIIGSVSETKKPNPKGYYAFTKFKGEQIIEKFAKKKGYYFAILRYFNVAGASRSKKIGEIEKSHGHLIKNIAIESLKSKPKIKIFGNNYKTKDGTCIRDYMHISDLTEIHLKALNYVIKNKKSLILNCGYGKGYSVKEIVDIFSKIKKNVKIIYLKKRPGDVAQVYSNIKRLKKVLKWKPKYNNIKNIILSSIKWEKNLRS